LHGGDTAADATRLALEPINPDRTTKLANPA